MKQECSNQKGFTLVELLVGMAVMAIMLSVALPLLSNMTTATARGQQANNGMQEVRWALQLMANDVRAGHVIDTPAAADTDSATFTFRRWNFPNTDISVTYSLVKNELCRQTGAGTKRPLTDGGRAPIQSVTFRKSVDGKNVTIVITLVNQKKMQQTVYLLNEGK